MDRQEIIEKRITSFLKKGDTFVDVGAYIGVNAILAASKIGQHGQVIAFEPSTDNYDALFKNTKDIANIICLKAACSIEKQEVKMYLSEVDPEDNRFYDFSRANDYETVKAVRLDDILLEDLTLLKVSAQGHEDYVIEGAKETIEKFRPHIMIDFNEPLIEESGSSPSEVLSYYDDMDYIWKFLYSEKKNGLLWLAPE